MTKVFSLRIAVELYDKIAKIAKENDRSVNYTIIKMLESAVSGK